MKSKAQEAADRVQQVIDQELKKGGFRGAINAFCCSCIYDPWSEGNWRVQVEKCPSSGKKSTKCPLYDVRPTSKGKKK